MATEDISIKANIDVGPVLKGINKLNKSFDTVKFAGYALSIMFFGQQIQKVFTTVQRFGTKSFQDVMHSVEGTVTQFDLLDSSVKYLGFTIGQALEPIVALIIPIIDQISEWTSKNPALTAGIIAVGSALGAIFAVGGAGILAINGFVELGTKLGLVKTGADGAITSVSGLSSALSKIGGTVAIGVAFIMAKDAFKDFEDKRFGDALFGSISSGLLAAGGLKLLRGAKGGGWLIALGFAVDRASEGTLFQDVARLIAPIVAMWEAGFNYIIQSFRNTQLIVTGRGGQASFKSFSDLYRESYQRFASDAQKIDTGISSFQNWANSPAQSSTSSTYYININQLVTSPESRTSVDLIGNILSQAGRSS